MSNKIFKNIIKEGFIVGLSDYLVFGVTFLITIIISNCYGLEELGIYTIILSISQIVILSINGSYTAIIRRDLSINPSQINFYTSNIVSIRIVTLIILTTIPLFISFTQFTNKYAVLLSFMLFSKGLESVNETFLTVYQTIGKIAQYSFFKLTQTILILTLIIILVYNEINITYIYSFPILINLLFTLIHFSYAKSIKLNIQFKIQKQFLIYLRKEAWPLFISVIVSQLNTRGSVLIISSFVSVVNLGIYSIGISLISLATTFINSLVVVLFPTLTKTFNQNSKYAHKIFKKLTFYSFLLSLAIFITFNLLSPLIPKVYSSLTSNSLTDIRIMSVAIIPIILMGISSYMFTIIGVQKQGMQLMIFLTIINLFIFALATYSLNFIGSTISYSFTLTITFLSFFLRINHILKRKIAVQTTL